ncbi:hypothetical protein BDF14DRAFT_1842146 [Spinellus fusiger]|nr:hypothetical protein BDF14DRAFT_1842146 [Spinellus fusiger]
MDIESWMDKIAEWEKGFFDQLSPFFVTKLLKTKLGSKAAKLVETSLHKTPDSLYDTLHKSFPVHGYKTQLIIKLSEGQCFEQHSPTSCIEETMRIYKILGPSDSAAYTVATALSKAFPITWAYTGMAPSQVTEANFKATLNKFSKYAEVTPSTVLALAPESQELRRQAPEPRNMVDQAQAQQHPSRSAMRKKRNRDHAAKNQELKKQIEALSMQVKALTTQINKGSLGKA